MHIVCLCIYCFSGVLAYRVIVLPIGVVYFYNIYFDAMQGQHPFRLLLKLVQESSPKQYRLLSLPLANNQNLKIRSRYWRHHTLAAQYLGTQPVAHLASSFLRTSSHIQYSASFQEKNNPLSYPAINLWNTTMTSTDKIFHWCYSGT